MNYKVKISVIIPIYNTEAYLKECLDSICNQTLEDIEIICVDDGSTDNSLSILKEYSEKDSRIIVLQNEHTGKGAAGARNKGLEYAQGEYLLILDSDDYFDVELAKKAYEKAIEKDADVVLFDANYLDKNDKCMLNKTVIFENAMPINDVFCYEDCEKTFFQITYTNAWSKLWKSSLIQNNNIKFQPVHWLDDALFMCEAMVSAKKITVLAEKLVYYRLFRDGNQSSTMDKDPIAGIKFAKELKDYLVNKEIYEVLKESFWNLVIQTCIYQLHTFNTSAAFCTLYNEFKTESFKELFDFQLCEESFSNENVNDEIWKTRKNQLNTILKILRTNIEEYLFEKSTLKKNISFVFPTNLVKENDKVVLFGAGMMGKAFFVQNLYNSYCKIIAWLDSNYVEKGYPICAPEMIRDIKYDKVLIAVENKKIVMEIEEKLIELGVDCEKII